MLNPQPVNVSRSATCQVLIVDDHPVVRGGLRFILSQEPGLAICAEASDISEAMRQLEQHRPHIAIVDLSLRDGSGLDLIKRMKAHQPGVKILVASIHDEHFYAQRVLDAGALGFVHKQESAAVMLQAIRQVMGGEIYLRRGVSPRGIGQATDEETGSSATDQNEDRPRSRLDHLSNRELEVLELIGRGLGTSQIAEKLYLSPKTIDTYREHLKTKLNLRNSVELMRYAVQWDIEQSG